MVPTPARRATSLMVGLRVDESVRVPGLGRLGGAFFGESGIAGSPEEHEAARLQLFVAE